MTLPRIRHLLVGVTCLLVLSAAPSPVAAAVDCADDGFWATAVTAHAAGDGGALRTALHALVEGHTVIPYTSNTGVDCWDALSVLDEDPNNQDNVVLVYSRRSEPKATQGLSTGWNREHLFPKSYGVGKTGADTSDLHSLRAADWSVNSARNNLYFGTCSPATDASCDSPAHPEAEATTAKNSDLFLPPATVRGDIARAMFYMAVRYDGNTAEDPNTLDIELSNSPAADLGLMGRLDTLLEWHAADPVDDAERARNTRVCTDYQHNRNPFVEHPEFAAVVDWTTYVRNPYPAPTASSQDDDVEDGGYVMQPGDVVLLAFDSDNPDELSFVATVDLPEGTVVKFTDNGWDTDAFREGEGVLKFRVGADGLAAGEVQTFSGQYVDGWEDGPGTLALSASGDQILVYGGGFDDPAFVYAVHYAGGGWDTDVTSTADTRLPEGLWDGVTAVTLTHKDNYVYSGPVAAATRAAFLLAVGNTANWAGSNEAVSGTLPSTITILPDSHPSEILLDAVPVYGSGESLSGTIPNPPASAIPGYYKVVTYVYNGGWWVKPFDGWPWFFVNDDWTYSGVFKSHDNDLTANFICVALVPIHASPALVLAAGTPVLPGSLAELEFARLVVSRGPNVLTFAGYNTWELLHNEPGTPPLNKGNYFSNDPSHVFVDSAGLHMSISNQGTAAAPSWVSTEVILRESLGYGTYVFQVVGPVSGLDPYAVLGLYTWEDASTEPYSREIDHEFSRWGSATDTNHGQFVVQPHDGIDSIRRYPLRGTSYTDGDHSGADVITCAFVWKAGEVHFISTKGLYSASELTDGHLPSAVVLDEWVFTGTSTTPVPTPGNAQVRLNLWQAVDIPGFDATTFSGSTVTVRNFEFVPQVAPPQHVQQLGSCAAAGRCWCAAPDGTAAACVASAAECAAPATCQQVQDGCGLEATPEDLRYHQPSNSLVTSTCNPNPPAMDNCAAPDLVLQGVEYWFRGGMGANMQLLPRPEDCSAL